MMTKPDIGNGMTAQAGNSQGLTIAGSICRAGVAFLWLALLLLLIIPQPVAADIADEEIVVIGHPRLGVEALSHQAVRDLYLGKTVQLANGTRVEIVDLPVGHAVRNSFYINVIGRDPGQMRAYWAKRIFTGKGSPPDTRPDERSVVRWVAAGQGRIAYVSASAIDDSVKVLLRQYDDEQPF